MLLHEMIEFAARKRPDAPALIFEDRCWSFAELCSEVDRAAAGLQRIAAPGDRVAIVAENCPEFAICYYAVPKAGMALTFLNARLRPEEHAVMLADAQPRVLMGQDRYLARIRAVGGSALGDGEAPPTTVALGAAGSADLAWGQLLAEHLPEPVTGASENDLAWLLYTSGTTGRAKGALLTHRSLTAAVTATAIARPVVPGDVYLFPFPLYHVAGYNMLNHHLHGRPVVLMPRFEAGRFLELVPAHRVTSVSLAPTMLAMVLDHPDSGSTDLGSLRLVAYGASAMPGDLLRRGLTEIGCDFAQGYGMTELSGNAVFLDPDAHRRAVSGEEHLLGAAGRPSPLVAVRVVEVFEDGDTPDPDHLIDVPVGTTGEIVMRGDQVTRGYWRDPQATAEAFAGEWFRTGDIGRWDDEGFLYVVDRKKDIIVTGGENVSSREVENVLHDHPAVREVAVIGIPDEHWGEAVCAVVVTREGSQLEAEELVELSRARLAGYKKPRHVLFVEELPKNASGKVLKRELRAGVLELLA